MIKALFILPDLPYPPIGGGRKRMHHLFKHLNNLGLSIELLSLAPPDKINQKNQLSHICKKVHLIKAESANFIKKGKRFFSLQAYEFNNDFFKKMLELNPNRFDFIFVAKPQMVHYVYPLRNSITCPIIIDLWGAGLKGALGEFIYERALFKKILTFFRIPRYVLSDSKMYRSFNNFTVVSGEIKNYILKRNPNKKVCVLPTCIETELRMAEGINKETGNLIFTADMAAFTNIDAMLYFTRRIYPIIKRKVPRVKLFIVGANPPGEIRKLAEVDETITVTGFVEDVNECLKKAFIYVAPFRCASGLKTNVLEAMAAGLPVVTTTIASEGIAVKNGENIILADNPQSFSSEVIKLVEDSQKAQLIGKKAKKLILENYNGEKIAKKLLEFYREIK